MSSSSSKSPLDGVPTQRLSFLVNYGLSLGAVLRQRKMMAKNKAIKIDPNVNNNAVEYIRRLKEELKTAKQSLVPPSYSLDERGGKRVIEKVEGILNELIYYDSEHEESYKDLRYEIGQLKDYRGLNLDSQKPQISGGTGDEFSYASQVLPLYKANNDRFVEAFNKLPYRKRVMLSDCLPIAKAYISDDDQFKPHNLVLSKGVLLNWLIGLFYWVNPTDEEQFLEEQFLEELVAEPSFNLMWANRSSRIIISKDFFKSLSSLDIASLDTAKNDSFPNTRFIKVTGGEELPTLKRRRTLPESFFMINRGTYKLNEQVFNVIDEAGVIHKIQNQTQHVYMVHLGNFHRGLGHVVVEDNFFSEFDEFLKKMKYIKFLSLQGISRILELPESVCKLRMLRVLDLRSCQDLKSLPKDIGSLNYLICLDLSECYQLDYIPKGITKLTNLMILMGFIITTDENLQLLKDSKQQVAEFADLNYLKKLIKLSIRTRRMSFPTNQDLQTLNEMQDLRKLKVKWVKSFVQSNPTADVSSAEESFYTEGLPETLLKLELQAAPDSKASQLLGLISKRSRYRNLKKIYISGGTLQTKLYPNHYCFPNVKILRLRYLPLLHMNWHDIQLSFPNLSDLQIVECPNLIFFPCDQNGDWIQSESSW